MYTRWTPITNELDPAAVSETQWGKLTNSQWVERELERLQRSGWLARARWADGMVSIEVLTTEER